MVLDYETYSETDLKKVGAFEYSVHHSTEIICAAWRVGKLHELENATTKCWVPKHNEDHLKEFVLNLINPKIILVAHNAFFEQCITNNVFATKYLPSFKKSIRSIPISKWRCTAAQAAAMALPRSLDGATSALGLPFKKDLEGHRLMLKWCKPRKPSKKNPSTRWDDIEELRRLVKYCVADIAAEVGVLLNTEPLNPFEQKLWELDQHINLRGVKVDRELVKNVLEMVKTVTQNLDEKISELTSGEVSTARKRDAILNWLAMQGYFLADLTKSTVEESLKENFPENIKEVLECRAAISKSSTAKYSAYEMRTRHDGRLRDILVYHAASTGRWGGSGVQLQNLPRPLIKNTVQAADVLLDGDLDLVDLLYGKPMDVFSSCLRNVLIASDGKVLDVADYSAIEVRVLFWVAQHWYGVKQYENKEDLYVELASRIFNKPIEKINRGFERFIGKTATLGCGYGMGHKKFKTMCEALDQEVSEEFAKLAVDTYRQINVPVVELWKRTETGAIAAILNPQRSFEHNYLKWYMDGKFLVCELPSKRKLFYYKPSVEWELTPWGFNKQVIYHYGVDSLIKKWVKQKTWGGVLVENFTQAIARDIMAEAMVRINETKNWEIVLSVHDELVAERDIDSKLGLADFCKLMATVPTWAKGCPIDVEGYTSKRYKK